MRITNIEPRDTGDEVRNMRGVYPELVEGTALRSLLRSRALYNCRGFSTNRPFYAKQTQFPKKSNERKYLFTDGL